jgi:5'-deoxynucleotidase YfbR-like HD superfamily hydrolase
MLSLHDIGETIDGDIPSYAKNEQQEKDEIESARSLIDPSLIKYFLEYEDGQTLDAKFAKSIDTLAPMLHHLSHQEIADEVYHRAQANLPALWNRKRKIMSWDGNLLAIYDFIADKLRSSYTIVWKPETEDE